MKTTTLILAIFLITIAANAQFKAGYYFTPNGDRVDGEIKVICYARMGKQPHTSLMFKGSDGKKIPLSTTEVRAFVQGTDSFMVVKNVSHGVADIPEDFVRVDDVDGDITMVTHRTTVGAGTDSYMDSLTLYVKNGKVYTSLEDAKKTK